MGTSLFIIGAAPLTDWLPGSVVRDSSGFVITGPDLMVGGDRPPSWDLARDPYLLESSIPGVFVAGDVRSQSVKRWHQRSARERSRSPWCIGT